MKYQKAIIYYASGTGNSYRLAEWFSEECSKRKIDSKIIQVNRAKPKDDLKSSVKKLVVFAYPTHGFMPPWSVIKLMFRMPFGKGAHIFFMPTRGCFHIGRVPVPGAAGLASILPIAIFPFKGYNVRGAVSFDMPANMLNIHPCLTENGIKRILERARGKADRTFRKLFSGKFFWFTKNNLWELIWGVGFLVLVPIFPVIYLLIGRLFMAKMLFANTDCTGCGICAEICPNEAIKMKGGQVKHPFWSYKCEDCFRCMAYCKFHAVEAGHSLAFLFVILIIFVWNLSVSRYIYFQLIRFSFNIVHIWNIYIDIFIKFISVYIAICLAYYGFHYLIRFKFINKIFMYTTFTHLYKRYHEPGTRIDQLVGK